MATPSAQTNDLGSMGCIVAGQVIDGAPQFNGKGESVGSDGDSIVTHPRIRLVGSGNRLKSKDPTPSGAPVINMLKFGAKIRDLL
jgi:hypothetical protein